SPGSWRWRFMMRRWPSTAWAWTTSTERIPMRSSRAPRPTPPRPCCAEPWAWAPTLSASADGAPTSHLTNHRPTEGLTQDDIAPFALTVAAGDRDRTEQHDAIVGRTSTGGKIFTFK